MIFSVEDEGSHYAVDGSPWIEALLVMIALGTSSATISSASSFECSECS